MARNQTIRTWYNTSYSQPWKQNNSLQIFTFFFFFQIYILEAKFKKQLSLIYTTDTKTKKISLSQKMRSTQIFYKNSNHDFKVSEIVWYPYWKTSYKKIFWSLIRKAHFGLFSFLFHKRYTNFDWNAITGRLYTIS